MNKPLRGEAHEHPVLDEVREHWYKIAAVLTWKLKNLTGEDVTITAAEFEAFANQFPGDDPAIIYAPKDDTIRLLVVAAREAMKKTRQ